MERKVMKILKTLVNATALSVAVLSFSASAAFKDFVVDETPYGGGLLGADKLNGSYKEVISFDGSGNFAVNAFASMTDLLTDDGLTSLSGTAKFGNDYKIYALFDATGTVSPVSASINSLDANGGAISLFLDANNDTTGTLGATASDAITLGSDGDDLLLATSVLNNGTGLLVSGVGGFFDILFDDFALTADGSNYFVTPDPFYAKLTVDGDFDDFTLSGNQVITGDVSAVFVPEPASLGIASLVLLGLAGLGRRKKS